MVHRECYSYYLDRIFDGYFAIIISITPSPFTCFQVGQKDSLTKTFTEDDVKTFAEISLDKNPIHIDEEFAKTYEEIWEQNINVFNEIGLLVATQV